MDDHGIRQPVSDKFHHKRARSDYGKTFCSMQD